jgi:hypothetical protein
MSIKYILYSLLLICLITSSFSTVTESYSQEYSTRRIVEQGKLYDQKNKSVSLDIECRSGTPPILEFILKDKELIVKKLSFDFDNDGVIDLVTPGLRDPSNENEVVFRGVPYRNKGVYRLTVYLHSSFGIFTRPFDIGFTDFVWGHDNYNFANDDKFENSIDFVSKTVIDWAEARFGSLTQEQQVLLLYVMYSIYKGSIGRCYGFSGGEVYYILFPDLIPPLYSNTFAMDERDIRIIKEMDYAQNDIVFTYFISGQIDLERPQKTDSAIAELEKIKKSIRTGKPIVLGYLSRKMHHSMAVYGYFENLFANNISLLTANNWEREQNDNIFSDDAENIKIRFNNGDVHISWYDIAKKKYRYPTMLFAIEPKEKYHIVPEDFFRLVTDTEKRLREKNKIIIMVEKTEIAYMIDEEGKMRGYKKPRYINETDKITFKKVDYNYIFEVPKGKEYTLVLVKPRFNKELNRKKEVNVFGVFPTDSDIMSAVFYGVRVDNRVETKFVVNDSGMTMLK